MFASNVFKDSTSDATIVKERSDNEIDLTPFRMSLDDTLDLFPWDSFKGKLSRTTKQEKGL